MTCSHSARRSGRRTTAAGLLALVLAAAPAAASAAPARGPASAPVPPVAVTGIAPDTANQSALQAAAEVAGTDLRAAQAEKAVPITADAVVGSFLGRGQSLAPGDAIASPSGKYSLIMDPSGLVLLQKAANRLAGAYAQSVALVGPADSRLVMQDDGNVVVYGPDGTAASDLGTGGTTGSSLVIQDDGNLVLYGTEGEVVYSFDTGDPEFLAPGGTLLPGERLISADRGTTLLMQLDGNLVLYTQGQARFSTATSTTGAAAVLQEDGNFVVYGPDNEPLFTTGTGRDSEFDALLVTDREFRLIGVDTDKGEELGVFSRFGSAWRTPVVESGLALLPGDRRTAAGGVQLIMQRDGNLVQYVNGTPRFRTGTRADLALMQPDGNFVLYQYRESVLELRAVFNTRTEGNPGSRLVAQGDRNIVVYTPDNRAVFSTLR